MTKTTVALSILFLFITAALDSPSHHDLNKFMCASSAMNFLGREVSSVGFVLTNEELTEYESRRAMELYTSPNYDGVSVLVTRVSVTLEENGVVLVSFRAVDFIGGSWKVLEYQQRPRC